MAYDALCTIPEAIAKTRLSSRTFRHYLQLWETCFCPLPAGSDNKILVSVSHMNLFQQTYSLPQTAKRVGVDQYLARDGGTPRALLKIAEEYHESPRVIPSGTDFVLSMVRLAANSEREELNWREFRFEAHRRGDRFTSDDHRRLLDKLNRRVSDLHDIVRVLVNDLHVVSSDGAARTDPERFFGPDQPESGPAADKPTS